MSTYGDALSTYDTPAWNEQQATPFGQPPSPAPISGGPFSRGTPDAPWSNQNAIIASALAAAQKPVSSATVPVPAGNPQGYSPKPPMTPVGPPTDPNGAINGYIAPMPGVAPTPPRVNMPNQHNQWGKFFSNITPYGLGPIIQALFSRKS